MLRGWISADVEDREELEKFGIRLGQYDYENCEFTECLVNEEAFTLLEPLWGEYVWGLELEKN
ncbi:hypothetical protein J2W97_001263 [Paenibacillus jamilae]|nr:hypothetical protein H6F38_14210 [Paenibacillus sp. EKM208P]MDP9675280.1 hypothetical protein [Paenibacillus jamilae]